MTVKIRVQDFQSIEDAEIEVSGLTVITGQNNSGKSAILRAVFGMFTNTRGTKYVRHGKPHCTVTLTFADGQTLTWEKGEKVNRYKVNGKDLNKVGAGVVPPEVDAFGILPVHAAGRELWPQFAQQFTGQVFLLDQPGTVLAESISDVTRVGVLNEALRETQSDRRTATSELKVRAGDVLRLEAQESTYAGLTQVETVIREAEVMDREVTRLQGEVTEIRTLRDTLAAFSATADEHLPVRWVTLPAGVEAIQQDIHTLLELQGMATKIQGLVHLRDTLAPVANLSFPNDESVARARKIAEALGLIVGLRSQMAPLKVIVSEGDTLREALDHPIPDLPTRQVHDLEELRRIRSDLDTRRGTVRDLRKESVDVEAQYDEALHEVRELLGGVGDCPICGRC